MAEDMRGRSARAVRGELNKAGGHGKTGPRRGNLLTREDVAEALLGHKISDENRFRTFLAGMRPDQFDGAGVLRDAILDYIDAGNASAASEFAFLLGSALVSEHAKRTTMPKAFTAGMLVEDGRRRDDARKHGRAGRAEGGGRKKKGKCSDDDLRFLVKQAMKIHGISRTAAAGRVGARLGLSTRTVLRRTRDR